MIPADKAEDGGCHDEGWLVEWWKTKEAILNEHTNKGEDEIMWDYKGEIYTLFLGSYKKDW